MSQNIFNRTVKTNIILYPTDGMGRDGYITYNNAGFWKENYKQISPKEKFARKPFAVFRSWRKIPPCWNYHSDGTGRDGYILCNFGGLIKKYESSCNKNAFLRSGNDDFYQSPIKNEFLSKAEKKYQQQINKIQRDLVTRLYDNYRLKNNNKILHKEKSALDLTNNKKITLLKNNYNKIDNNNCNTLHQNFRSKSQIRDYEKLPDVRNNNNLNHSMKKNDFYSKGNLRKYKIKCLASSADDKYYGSCGNIISQNEKKFFDNSGGDNEY